MTTKSAKHSNKAFGSEKDKAAKAVDIRKVAALSVGAAGVIAGAAIAFGATPAMAAEATSAPVKEDAPVKEQDLTAKNDDSKTSDDSKKKFDEKQQTDETNQNKQTVVKTNNTEGKTNKKATDNAPAPSSAPAETNTYAASSTPAEAPAGSNNGTDRAATPAPAPKVNSEITLSKETKDTLPNMYAWGSADNTYIENGQNTSVKITLKSADGIAVTKVAIFPNDNIDINGRNAKDFVEYKTGDDKAHQPYSGEYAFATNNDGSATLTVNKLYRNNNMAAAGYAANRCIYVYGMKDGQEVLLYKTNIARAATLIPPKKTGSFVLRYDQKLEDKTPFVKSFRKPLMLLLQARMVSRSAIKFKWQAQLKALACVTKITKRSLTLRQIPLKTR